MVASHCNHSLLFGSGMCNTDTRGKALKTKETHHGTHTFLMFVIFHQNQQTANMKKNYILRNLLIGMETFLVFE